MVWFSSLDESEADSRPTDAAAVEGETRKAEPLTTSKTVEVAATETTVDAMADEPAPIRCLDCEDAAALAPLTPSNLRLIAAGSEGSTVQRRAEGKGDDLHSETCSQTSRWSHSTGGALQRSMELQAGSPGLTMRRATTGFGWGAGRTTGALKNMDELDELTEASAVVAASDETRVNGDLEVD